MTFYGTQFHMMARNARIINHNGIIVVTANFDNTLVERHGFCTLDDKKGIFGNRMIQILGIYFPNSGRLLSFPSGLNLSLRRFSI